MCKSHTKKIGALKLSQQDVGKNCIFRGCELNKLTFFFFVLFGFLSAKRYFLMKNILLSLFLKKKKEREGRGERKGMFFYFFMCFPVG